MPEICVPTELIASECGPMKRGSNAGAGPACVRHSLLMCKASVDPVQSSNRLPGNSTKAA